MSNDPTDKERALAILHPADCVHRNLHPGRVDGSWTICFDCQRPIHLGVSVTASGKTIFEQYVALTDKLNDSLFTSPKEPT